MCGDCRPGECTFPFFFFIPNPGHTDINNIGSKLTGIRFDQISSAFGIDFNCGYFRLTASQLLGFSGNPPWAVNWKKDKLGK